MEYLGRGLRSLNVEITNRCVLACPECARTGNPWVEDDLTDLPVALVERVFPLDERARLAGLRINLCGAHGDCAYHPRFHAVLAHLKAAGLRVCMETNGSHRKPGWWERTCALLDEDDSIVFSVDGLADSNHLYRVNARWDDIEGAMRTCAPRVAVHWKFIVFRHNEHQLEAARALAADIGVRSLAFKKSARFRHDDPLAPRDPRFIGVVTRNRRTIAEVASGPGGTERLEREVAIRPKCRAAKDLAITARGYLYPCTVCESGDPSTWFSRHREAFDLRRHSLAQILASPHWRELERLWQRPSTAPASCLRYCGVHRGHQQAYARASRPDRPDKPEDLVAVKL